MRTDDESTRNGKNESGRGVGKGEGKKLCTKTDSGDRPDSGDARTMNGHMTKHTFRVKIFVINFVWRPLAIFHIFINFSFFFTSRYALMDECVCAHLSGTFVCVHMVLKVLSRNGIINGNSHQLIAQFAQVMSAGTAY